MGVQMSKEAGVLTRRMIVKAVAKMLSERYPDWDVHRNREPANFTRPAFLVECPAVRTASACRDAVEETVYLTITCFGRKDHYGESEADELALVQEEVMALFRAGYIRVGDRAVKCEASEGGQDFDRAWVDLTVRYFEQRGPQADYPLMREIHSNTNI